MNREDFIGSIEATFKKGVEIVKRKNADYANSENPFKNFESAKVINLTVEQAILVRVLDKLTRVSNLLVKEAAVEDEGLEDTLIDAINYLAIMKAHLEKRSRSGEYIKEVDGNK